MGTSGPVRRSRRGPRTALAVLGACLLLLGLVGPDALAQTVRAGRLIVTVEGGFTPHKLPKQTPASITLSARSTIRTSDGSHLPALQELTLKFDKHTGVHTKGLPTCDINKLRNTVTKQAKKICSDALIGTGQAGAEIEFPEQPPFFAKAPMLIFNGPPHNGHPVFIFHVYAFVPAPTTFVTTAQIGRSSGLYGTKVLIKIPTILAGQGSLSFAELSIHKTWMYKGKKQTLLYGTCPTGHFFVRGDLLFNNGFRMSGKVVRSCTPEAG
ncbi:MAG: hypothetical protein ACHQCF_04240 [Solirubrobacterales bacterium]